MEPLPQMTDTPLFGKASIQMPSQSELPEFIGGASLLLEKRTPEVFHFEIDTAAFTALISELPFNVLTAFFDRIDCDQEGGDEDTITDQKLGALLYGWICLYFHHTYPEQELPTIDEATLVIHEFGDIIWQKQLEQGQTLTRNDLETIRTWLYETYQDPVEEGGVYRTQSGRTVQVIQTAEDEEEIIALVEHLSGAKQFRAAKSLFHYSENIREDMINEAELVLARTYDAELTSEMLSIFRKALLDRKFVKMVEFLGDDSENIDEQLVKRCLLSILPNLEVSWVDDDHFNLACLALTAITKNVIVRNHILQVVQSLTFDHNLSQDNFVVLPSDISVFSSMQSLPRVLSASPR